MSIYYIYIYIYIYVCTCVLCAWYLCTCVLCTVYCVLCTCLPSRVDNSLSSRLRRVGTMVFRGQMRWAGRGGPSLHLGVQGQCVNRGQALYGLSPGQTPSQRDWPLTLQARPRLAPRHSWQLRPGPPPHSHTATSTLRQRHARGVRGIRHPFLVSSKASPEEAGWDQAWNFHAP